MMLENSTNLIITAVAALLPSLVWLVIWLSEDRRRPEPAKIILVTFIAGAASVPLVLLAEQYVGKLLIGDIPIRSAFRTAVGASFITLVAWSAIEEVGKYLAAKFSGLRRKDADEPLDMAVYMICAALGFAAMENFAFLYENTLLDSFTIGNMRFLGATLLHVLTSGTIGVSLAFGYYKPRIQKVSYAAVGILTAVLLHAAFNFFIIYGNGYGMIASFAFVWVCCVGLLIALQKTKKVRPCL